MRSYKKKIFLRENNLDERGDRLKIKNRHKRGDISSGNVLFISVANTVCLSTLVT